MRKSLLGFLLTIACCSAFAQTNYSGSIDVSDPTFNRPEEGAPPTTLSTTATMSHYDVIVFTVVNPGMVTFVSNSIWDNFGILYGPGGFNPAAPLDNALLANDDFVGTNFGFTYEFTVPGTYTLVITTFKNPPAGDYSISITEAGVLPVKLTSFAADKLGASGNRVRWTTAEELNIERYEVLRSNDGIHFSNLANASTPARNNGAGASYSLVDEKPVAGMNFYRLRITDKSGKTSLSQIAVVNNRSANAATIKVFPNPATNFLYLQTKATRAEKAQVSIMDALGRTVYSRSFKVNDQPVLTIDVQQLSRGKYFVRTVIGNEQTSMSFIKN